MELLIVLLAVAVLGAAAIAAAGGLGQMRSEPVRDVYQPTLPDRMLQAGDLEDLRFGVTPRGYSIAQVDALVDRIRRELVHRQTNPASMWPEDLQHVRFDMTARGYQMKQVDAFLERAQCELAGRSE